MNEINFSFVEKYIKEGKELPNFMKILQMQSCRTISENKYELLEPWIQWVSAHTGKTFEEHNIFRLGDIVNSDVDQILKRLKEKDTQWELCLQ